MADAKLTALTAASALAAADLFYVSQSAASRKATGTQLLTLVGTTYVPLAGGTMTGALTIASGTLTASAPGLNITQTWNAVGTRFDGAVVNVTNTTSAAGSFIQTWQLAGVNKVAVNKTGGLEVYQLATDASNYERLTLTGVAGTSVNIVAETLGTGGDNLDIVLTPAGNGSVVFPNSTYINSTGFGVLSGIKCGVESSLNYYASGLRIFSVGEVAWTNTTSVNAAVDTALMRNAAGVVEVNNGTAGTYRDLKLRNLIQTEYTELTEMTAPAAPATNSVRIYAEDNGAGKTRLMALFATGSAVQIAVEP